MTKRALRERRERNAALAARDRSHRCPICKRDLSKGPAVIRVQGDQAIKYCADGCLDDAEGN